MGDKHIFQHFELTNSRSPDISSAWSISAVVFFSAFLANIPALNSWWCLDDWGQLARAAGITNADSTIPARWLSQYFYWIATWPLFGLASTPYALSRIIFHSVSSVIITRISKKAGLGSTASLIAGLVFAASPISFTALYWASGVQELLGGLFALLAIERWMEGNRKNTLLAILFGICSILSKESALGLPLFLMITLIWKYRRGQAHSVFTWTLVFVLALVGIFEGILVWRSFPTGLLDPYRMGGILVVLGNTGKFGWWLLTQGPIFTGQVTWKLAGVGLAFWALWASWAFIALRKGSILPVAAFLSAILSLAPALVLVYQARPYMGYIAMACLAMALGCLWPKRWNPGIIIKGVMVVAAVSWGLWGMSTRAGNLSTDGLPADPIVRAMESSRVWSQYLKDNLPESGLEGISEVVVLQLPLRSEDIDRANRFGDSFILETELHKLLGGAPGLALIAGNGINALWVNSLMEVPSDAFVFCQTTSGLKAWGRNRDALIYASLLDIFVGNFQRAQSQLQLAARIDDRFELFNFDPELLQLPKEYFRKQSERYVDSILNSNGAENGLGSPTNDYGLFLKLMKRIRELD